MRRRTWSLVATSAAHVSDISDRRIGSDVVGNDPKAAHHSSVAPKKPKCAQTGLISVNSGPRLGRHRPTSPHVAEFDQVSPSLTKPGPVLAKFGEVCCSQVFPDMLVDAHQCQPNAGVKVGRLFGDFGRCLTNLVTTDVDRLWLDMADIGQVLAKLGRC